MADPVDELLEKATARRLVAAEPTTAPSGDPWMRVVQASERAVAERLPPWGRPIARAMLWPTPKTTPELAATALMAVPVGGPAAAVAGRFGLPAVARSIQWLSGRGLLPALSRSAVTGGAVGGAGAATGHDPAMAGVLGAGGRLLAEGTGKVSETLLQSATVKRLVSERTEALGDAMRAILPRWIAADRPAKAVLTDVLADAPAQKIGTEMGAIIARHEDLPIPLDATLLSGVMGAGQARALREVPGVRGSAAFGPLWRAVREAESTPEIRALESDLMTRFATLVPDPSDALLFRGLRSAYAQAKTLRDFLSGGGNPEAALERLFDSRGNLSLEGWRELTGRLVVQGGRTNRALGPTGLLALQDALRIDPTAGAARVEAGEALRPALSVFGIGRPHAYLRGLPHPAWAPEWEAHAPAAVRALTSGALPVVAAEAPLKVFSPPRREE